MTHPPITPPPELMGKRYAEADDLVGIATRRAARWAADQEMEAWINDFHASDSSWGEDSELITGLRAARRPKPLSLKEQAIAVLDDCSDKLDAAHENIIRRALEALDD